MNEEPSTEEGETAEPEGLPEGSLGEDTGETITITITVDDGGGDETGPDPVDEDEDGDDPVVEPAENDPIWDRE